MAGARLLGDSAAEQVSPSSLHWESRAVWQVSGSHRPPWSPEVFEKPILGTRKLLLLMKKSGGRKMRLTRAAEDCLWAEEDANGFAPKLQRQSRLGMHADVSAVTDGILSKD